MGPCVWILPVPKSVKSVSSKTAVADSSVSPATEIRMDRWKRQRNVQVVLGAHVGDLVGRGNLTFQEAVQWLETELGFGTWDQSRFRFRGEVSSEEYNRKSFKIFISKFVKTWNLLLFPNMSKTTWVLQRKQMYTPKFVKVSVSFKILQSRSATRNGHDLLSLNKLMREAKSMPDLYWWIVSVLSSFVWLTTADGTWTNRPDGSSTSGHVITAAWNSRKIRRVVRSSLGAGCAAFSTGPEHTDMLRVLCSELCGDLCGPAECENGLQATDALCVNDCKRLADALLAAGSAASKTSEDKRLGFEPPRCASSSTKIDATPRTTMSNHPCFFKYFSGCVKMRLDSRNTATSL